MSVSIYDGTNGVLKQIAGREDTSYWEGTQAQWNALSSADKALWTGKYVIITDDEESVNKYNGTGLINIAGKGQSITVDSALSDTSTNPVQNKVIKTALDEKDTAISKREVLVLTASGIPALPYTFSNSAIETDMVCINSVLSNPSAQISDWTVNTDTAGSCVVSGTINGSTGLTLYLMKSQ